MFIYPFFMRYAVFITKRYFKHVNIVGEISNKQTPVLLIANHISWWDGFWAAYLNETILKRKFHFMMLEEQLLKYWFFNYAGGFSVKKKSVSIMETLNYTTQLLTNRANMVLVYPQGEIQSMHTQYFQFEKGIERILHGKEDAVQVIFAYNMVDYFSQRKPSLTMYIAEYNSAFDLNSIQTFYNAFRNACVEKQTQLKA